MNTDRQEAFVQNTQIMFIKSTVVAAVTAAIIVGPPASTYIIGVCFMLTLYAVYLTRQPWKAPIVRLKGLEWTREDFCRGWLITGDTGSGKTRSGISRLLYQVFQNEPRWGGLCIDDKGVYWETLSAMAKHFNRQDDLILLQVRPGNAPPNWQPLHTYNLTSDPAIPYTTMAKFIVDTAASLGQQGDKAFFKNQAQMYLGTALEMLHENRKTPSLRSAYAMLLDQELLLAEIGGLLKRGPSPRADYLIDQFKNRFLLQPPEQLSAVKETIGNYLQGFLLPDIAQVFSAEKNSFELADMDQGKIICVVMPQKYQAERRYVSTFLKMLFYAHVLRRFDQPAEQRQKENLLILWADEAQRFMTAAEHGISDYNTIDVLREANATIVAAAQSSTSFAPPLGRDKAKVLLLNLRNRIIFKAADEECAINSANFLGKRVVKKKSWGRSAGKSNYSYTEAEEYRIKPYELRLLPKHTAVIVHCENRYKKGVLAPIEPNGTISPWFKRGWVAWWRLLFNGGAR